MCQRDPNQAPDILIEREPLYALHEWAGRFDESLLGLPEGAACLLNDDRVGRALDALFLADRAALLMDIVVGAVQAFDVDLRELHNDSTTVTFTGDYAAATGGPIRHPHAQGDFGGSKRAAPKAGRRQQSRKDDLSCCRGFGDLVGFGGQKTVNAPAPNTASADHKLSYPT